MPQLIPVDHDPFADPWQAGVDRAISFDRPTPEVTGQDRARELMMAMGRAGGDLQKNAHLLAETAPGRMVQGVARFARGETPVAGPGLRREDYTDDPNARQPVEPMIHDAMNMADVMSLGGMPMAARGAAGAMGGKLIQPEGIRAYHGSPHDFERFDISKIGTGEGAQSYGHGLYFAENPAVAADYKRRLAPRSTDDAMAQELARRNGLSWSEMTGADRQRYIDEVVKNPIETTAIPKGKMYEVNINAKPDQFLDWDKPLAQQSHLLPQLNEAGVTPKAINTDTLARHGEWGKAQAQYLNDIGNKTGQALYLEAGLGRGGYGRDVGPPATQALREAGIPGIKYLDQGSRGLAGNAGNRQRNLDMAQQLLDEARRVGDPRLLADAQTKLARATEDMARTESSNYVLFDDKIISILRKYGIGGLAALPPAVAAHVQSRLKPVEHDPFAQRLVPVDHDPFQ